MEVIGNHKLWSFLDDQSDCVATTNTAVRKGRGYVVSSFLDLAKKVAELQFRNRDHVFLFRGQTADHRNRYGNTTLKPSLFRGAGVKNPGARTLLGRFQTLIEAERSLATEYAKESRLGRQRLHRHRIVRWSILQHYKVCETPLLDVTHSLRIAASFATHGVTEEAFVYVLGVPNLSGGITASAEAGIQTVRLSSVCPPSAIRPHIQEGYLLGEYPEMGDFSQKELYRHYEIDFGRRLLAKFRLDLKSFWEDESFPLIPQPALYPSPEKDLLRKLTDSVRESLPDIQESSHVSP